MAPQCHTCIHIVGPPTGLAAASRWGAACPRIEDVINRALHLAVINGLGALGGAGEGGKGSGVPRVGQDTGTQTKEACTDAPQCGEPVPADSSTLGHSLCAHPCTRLRAPWAQLACCPSSSPFWVVIPRFTELPMWKVAKPLTASSAPPSIQHQSPGSFWGQNAGSATKLRHQDITLFFVKIVNIEIL